MRPAGTERAILDPMRQWPLRLGSVGLFAIGTFTACFLGGGSSELSDGGGDGGPGSDAMVLPFQADPPSVYVAKVKNILTGLAPTDSEIQQVTMASDPQTELATLIQGWQQQPGNTANTFGVSLNPYQLKLLRFFQLAFQQVQITNKDVETMLSQKTVTKNQAILPSIMSNIETSFAMTMLMQSVQGAQKFNIAPNTNTFAMTTAMMEFYGYLDAMQVDDTGNAPGPKDGTLLMGLPSTLYLTSKVIPPSDSANPANPNGNYMHWTNAAVTSAFCNGNTTVSLPMSSYNLHQALDGWWDGTLMGQCNGSFLGTAATSILQPSDFNDWRLITINQSNTPSAWTAWWDIASLEKLPSGASITFRVPRVGFFSTPAFFANWQTNDSNQMRVTMNQAFIVALGSSVDGTDSTTTSPTVPGLAIDHAGTSGACFGCHQLLDPSRGALMSTYSWFYHQQNLTTSPYNGEPDAGFGVPAGGYEFAFRGDVVPNINTVQDLGNALASHPNFPMAWAQKLCIWANSAPCDQAINANGQLQDPVFQQVVSAFASDGNWNNLVVNLMSSPIITNAVQTATEQVNGEVVAVARRDHLCTALNERLGFKDLCGLSGFDAAAYSTVVTEIANGLPSDSYGRGAAIPNLPNAPTLFSYAANQDVCEQIAVTLVDNPPIGPLCTTADEGSPRTTPCYWSSSNATNVTNAINDFVTLVMAIEPSDPRSAQAVSALTTAYQDALAAAPDAGGPATPTLALQTTFAAACESPSAVSIGM